MKKLNTMTITLCTLIIVLFLFQGCQLLLPSAHTAAPAAGNDSSSDIPPDLSGYITIKGERYSTALTELSFEFMDLHDEDLYQLRYMPNLTWLDLSYNPITDLTPLAGLVNLRTLHMKGNPIRDWTPVSHVDVVLGRPD